MSLANFSVWNWVKPKPVSGRATQAAFAAGGRVFQQNGVNPHLKNAVKRSLRNTRNRQRSATLVVSD